MNESDIKFGHVLQAEDLRELLRDQNTDNDQSPERGKQVAHLVETRNMLRTS